MINNKAAINQIFTFLMVAILIGLIFLFGIKAMKGVVTDTCEADKVLFVKEMQSYLEKYNVYGSLKKEDILLPCHYTQICFIESSVLGKSEEDITVFNSQINPMIRESILANVSYNVFLLDQNIATPLLYYDNLNIEGDYNYICLEPVGKKTPVVFIGEGKTVAIGTSQLAGG